MSRHTKNTISDGIWHLRENTFEIYIPVFSLRKQARRTSCWHILKETKLCFQKYFYIHWNLLANVKKMLQEVLSHQRRSIPLQWSNQRNVYLFKVVRTFVRTARRKQDMKMHGKELTSSGEGGEGLKRNRLFEGIASVRPGILA